MMEYFREEAGIISDPLGENLVDETNNLSELLKDEAKTSRTSDLQPNQQLLYLRELWAIGKTLRRCLEERSLTTRSVCFHLLQSVTESTKQINQEFPRIVCRSEDLLAKEIERRTLIFQNFGISLGSIVPNIKSYDEVELGIVTESGTPYQPAEFEEPTEDIENDQCSLSSNEIRLALLRALFIADTLLENGAILPLSGAISVAAGAYNLDYQKFSENPVESIGYLSLTIVRSREDDDQHLGQALEALDYLIDLCEDSSFSTTVWFVRALGLDHIGYGNNHNRLLARCFMSLTNFARALLDQNRKCTPEVMIQLVSALYEACTYFRLKGELVPLITLLLKNQDVLKEVTYCPPEQFQKYAMVCGYVDEHFTQSSFLARVMGVFAWTAEYNPNSRLITMEPFGPEEKKILEYNKPMWQRMDLQLYINIIESILGRVALSSTDQIAQLPALAHCQSRFMVGIALDSLFRIFRHGSLVNALQQIQRPDGTFLSAEQIGVWLRNGAFLLNKRRGYEENLHPSHARKVAALVAQLKTEFADDDCIRSKFRENAYYRSTELERLEALKNVLEFENRLNTIAFEGFKGTLEQLLKDEEQLLEQKKLTPKDWYDRPDAFLMGKYKSSSFQTPKTWERARSVLRYLRVLASEEEVYEKKWLNISFDAQRFFRKLQRVTADCASYWSALVSGGNFISGLKWLRVLAGLTHKTVSFEESFPIWRSFYNEQRIPMQRDVLHTVAILEPWTSMVLESPGSSEYQTVVKLLEDFGIPVQQAKSVDNHVLMKFLAPDLEEAIEETIRIEYPGPFKRANRNSSKSFGLNSFEASVKPHLMEFLKTLSSGPDRLVEKYSINSNCFFMMYEVDFLIHLKMKGGRRKIIIVRCNGEAWHQFFGGVPTNTDQTKRTVLENAASYLDLAPYEVSVLQIAQGAYQNICEEDQRQLVLDLLYSTLPS